jgi:hypothetical protein
VDGLTKFFISFALISAVLIIFLLTWEVEWRG